MMYICIRVYYSHACRTFHFQFIILGFIRARGVVLFSAADVSMLQKWWLHCGYDFNYACVMFLCGAVDIAEGVWAYYYAEVFAIVMAQKWRICVARSESRPHCLNKHLPKSMFVYGDICKQIYLYSWVYIVYTKRILYFKDFIALRSAEVCKVWIWRWICQFFQQYANDFLVAE